MHLIANYYCNQMSTLEKLSIRIIMESMPNVNYILNTGRRSDKDFIDFDKKRNEGQGTLKARPSFEMDCR
jgi:hypothetical protein